MNASQKTWAHPSDLEVAVKDGIVHRTNGRVDALEVEVIEKRVVVRGRVASFHLKQLAIQGVFDIIGSNSESTLEIDLQVIVVPLVQDGDVT